MGDREITGRCSVCGTLCVDGDPHCDCWDMDSTPCISCGDPTNQETGWLGDDGWYCRTCVVIERGGKP